MNQPAQESVSREILIVETDEELRKSMTRALSALGAVTAVATATECRTRIAEKPFALAVLDLVLPDDSGFAIVRSLRQSARTRIIVHTRRDTLADRVEAYTQGADIFMFKPAPEAEMLAAARALLGRSDPPQQEEVSVWRLGAAGALYAPGGERVRLSPRQAAFLKYLARAAGQPVAREELRRIVGIEETDANGRALDMFVRRLRKTIEGQARQKAPVRTVYGRGFAYDPTFF